MDLADLYHWWAQQMRSLLPAKDGSGAESDALVLQALGGVDFAVAVRRRAKSQPIGTIRLDRAGLAQANTVLARGRPAGRVVLALPATMLLEQHTTLPLATEGELGAILGHEMDRLTPFAPADVFWTWRVTERDRANQRLTVRLSILPKQAVLAALQALALAGLRPVVLEVPGPGGGVRRISTAPPGGRPPAPTALLRAAAWGCAVLAVGVVVVPVVQQARALAAVQDRIDGLQPRIALVDGLRRKLSTATGGTDVFAAEETRAGNALRTLAAVTAGLPDDTYLTEFTLRDRKATLTGRSAAAVRLIGLLSAAPDLSNPAFAAPVIRMAGDRGDQFTITVDLAR